MDKQFRMLLSVLLSVVVVCAKLSRLSGQNIACQQMTLIATKVSGKHYRYMTSIDSLANKTAYFSEIIRLKRCRRVRLCTYGEALEMMINDIRAGIWSVHVPAYA